MIKNSVSVLIPCFNASKFLYKTIQSVLDQTVKIDKIIVINDGSTDDSCEILKKFDTKILVLQHEFGHNKGQALSLNLGLQYVDSEFVAFLDSDDLWYKNKLSCQVNILNSNPEYLLCYTNGYVIDEQDRPLYPIFPVGFEEKNRIGNILLDCYIRTPSMAMVRRSMFDRIGFFSESFSAPDHDMWIRASEVGKFYFLDRDLVSYRQHSGQLSVIHARKMWENEFAVLQGAAKRYPYPARLKQKRKAVLYFRIALCDFKDRKFINSIYSCMRSFVYDPFRSIEFFSFFCLRIIRKLLLSN